MSIKKYPSVLGWKIISALGYTFIILGILGWLVSAWSIVGALVLFFIGYWPLKFASKKLEYAKLIEKYLKILNVNDSIDLSSLARRVRRKRAQVISDLQYIIRKGYLEYGAYVDVNANCFVKHGTAPKKQKEEKTSKKKAEIIDEYTKILLALRDANDRIPDEMLSTKIDRLETISSLIFNELKEHPEKKKRINSFFDYYLPTTQKLLDTYAEFDAMGVEGENLTQTKQRIAAMMDSIVEGFEHQLDQLYSIDAMDIASDIKVMETILQRDQASVEKDFGNTQTCS